MSVAETVGKILDQSRRNYGTPYYHQGRQPGRRLDCLGHAKTSYAAGGIMVPGDRDYRRLSRELRRLLVGLERSIGPRRGDRRDGDFLVFLIGYRRIVHCGVKDGQGFSHVELDGKVCWQRWTPRWQSGLVAVFGLRE